jgi:hypothetical protein
MRTKEAIRLLGTILFFDSSEKFMGELRLDHDATISAVDTSHTVQQENQKTPQGDELEAALREMIVSRLWPVAPRTDDRRSPSRSHVYGNAFLVGCEAGASMGKSSMMMAVV